MKTETLISFLCDILDAGYLDVQYIINQAESLDIELSDVIDELKANEIELSANAIISEMQRVYMQRMNDELEIELEDGTHYETFTNCMDSHIWILKDGKPISKEFGVKVLKTIAAHIEKW